MQSKKYQKRFQRRVHLRRSVNNLSVNAMPKSNGLCQFDRHGWAMRPGVDKLFAHSLDEAGSLEIGLVKTAGRVA